MTPDDIQWSDPPTSLQNRVKEFVCVLRQRPGEWAIYPFPLSRNGALNSASQNPKRHPGTEWVCRGGQLYGRWVGE